MPCWHVLALGRLGLWIDGKQAAQRSLGIDWQLDRLVSDALYIFPSGALLGHWLKR